MPVSMIIPLGSGCMGEETCSTSAPSSAEIRAAIGPAMTCELSSTRSPVSGRADDSSPVAGKGSGALSPTFSRWTSGWPSSSRPCGWARHSCRVRTATAVPPREQIASSSSKASQCAIASAMRCRPGGQSSTSQAMSRSSG